jgi:putative ABC transport system ATP-binding protein
MDRPAHDLVVEDLVIEYSSGGYAVRPIDGLNLHIGSGELVLLLGASGCGKTTLLSAMAGILSPKSGAIRFGDVDVTQLSGAALTRYRWETVGIVFQAFNLIPSLPAVDNVAVPMRSVGMRGRAARERASQLLDDVNLSERKHHLPGDMSGGQQQRVAIARALAHDPPLVLADEPTAHLDYIQVDGVLQLLRTLAQPGRIVVVATHDERLLPLADRVVELTPRAAPVSAEPTRRELAPGEVLFHQGDAGDLVYEVESGTIDIVRDRVDGSEELLAQVPTGAYFGELAPLFGLRRSATARAATPAVVVGMSVTEFRARYGDRSAGAGAASQHPDAQGAPA